MRILIAVPCADQVSAGFVQSLVMLKTDGETTVRLMPGSLIYENRNRLASLAIQMDAELVLWLDSDMVFEPDLPEKLYADIADGHDIVTGLYFGRRYPYFPVIYKKAGFEDGVAVCEGYDAYPTDGLFEVAGCGFGAVLMKTEVLRTLEERYDNWFAPFIGFGEDLSFCIRARECGYTIVCDPSVKPGHIGNVTVTEKYHKVVNKGNP